MARARNAAPVKLICGLLSGDEDLLRRTQQVLSRRFGPLDLESDLWAFHETDYYAKQMGPDLKRRFISFERLISPRSLQQIKTETNVMEEAIAEQCLDPVITRPVNIDPGYVDLAKLVLATTKDRSHRIYLGQGIYAEVTLHYHGHRWDIWPWTYPDYRRPECHRFFDEVRQRLVVQRQADDERHRPEDPE